MTQPTNKVQGKFYPLQHEEWLRACRELTPTQRDVLYYIRTLDPYNNGIDINCAEIARQLSGSKKVYRETVSRAIKALDQLGFINAEILTVRVKVKPKGLFCSSQTHRDNQITHRDDQITQGATRSRTVIATHHTKAENLVETESQNSKTNKTYSDFIKTLSEGERENFWEFGLKKAHLLPKPPELPLKWIEANWEELRSQWEKTEPGRTYHSSQIDWTQQPDWEDWLAQMREGVPRFVALGTCFDTETRRAIADWADEHGLIWGNES